MIFRQSRKNCWKVRIEKNSKLLVADASKCHFQGNSRLFTIEKKLEKRMGMLDHYQYSFEQMLEILQEEWKLLNFQNILREQGDIIYLKSFLSESFALKSYEKYDIIGNNTFKQSQKYGGK